MDTEQATVPYGYCHCGCGTKTSLAARNRADRGWVKGQPQAYVAGHSKRNSGPRFVEEDHGLETPCHIWQLYRMSNGYGRLGRALAHRLAWEEAYGPIPEGLWVCHRCDNPPCVNPAHLFLGTPSDNQHDCVAKGRRILPGGEQHPGARLTWRDVLAIRASPGRPVDLAQRYGVAPSTIHAVLTRRSWNRNRPEDP